LLRELGSRVGPDGPTEGTVDPCSMCATSNTKASSFLLRSILPANRSPHGEWIGRPLVSSAGDRADEPVQPSPSRVLVSAGLWCARRTCGEPESNPRTRETKYLIAYCADGPEPRATSGQGRAYSAARGRVAHGFISRLWHAQRYTSNNRSALQTIDWPKSGFPCAKSLSIDLRQMSRFIAACSFDARTPLHTDSFYARSIWVRCDAQPRHTGAQF
jgi:hypothetical protein